MKRLSKIIVVIMLVGVTLFGVEAKPAMADDSQGGANGSGQTTGKYTCDSSSVRVTSGGGESVDDPAECAQPFESRKLVPTVSDIINVILAVLGIVAVLVIILGGIMYITSTGDMARVAQAKNIIQYALVGLVISLLAWAIVNFVLNGIAVQQK